MNKSKVFVITGASSGIGKATAKTIATLGCRVVMVCRNKDKGMTVKAEIEAATNNKLIDLRIADLSSQADIKKLASELKASYPIIDVLINNAGSINPKLNFTADHIETTFAVNHLAYFLLTNLLLDSIKGSINGRIINVASRLDNMGEIYFDDVNLSTHYTPFKAYCQSKLANVMFTIELAEKIANTNIICNAMHPGGVNTGFSANTSGLFGFLFRLMSPILRSAEKGAETIIWLATSAEGGSLNGKYIMDCKEIKANKIAYNSQGRKKLWQLSLKMTNMLFT